MTTREIAPSTSPQPEPVEAPKAAPARKGDSATALSDKELHLLIAQGAYRRAEQRAFVPGHELDDWLQAEAEIRQLLS